MRYTLQRATLNVQCSLLTMGRSFHLLTVHVALVQWSLRTERRTWNKLSEDLGSNACYNNMLASWPQVTRRLLNVASTSINMRRTSMIPSQSCWKYYSNESKVTLEIENGTTIPRRLQETVESKSGTKARRLQVSCVPSFFPWHRRSISSVGKTFYEMFALCFFHFVFNKQTGFHRPLSE